MLGIAYCGGSCPAYWTLQLLSQIQSGQTDASGLVSVILDTVVDRPVEKEDRERVKALLCRQQESALASTGANK